MKTPRDISLAKKVLFSLIPLLLIVICLETLLRFVPIHEDSDRTLSGFVVPDPELIWKLHPRDQGPLATNELGLRDMPLNPNADKTILLLGDSVDWGDSIRDVRRIFPSLTEQFLNEKHEQTFEIVNSGVPGYSTFQQLRYLQLYGLKLEPDMIILQFCLNDVVERYSSVAEYGGDNVFLGVDTRRAIKGLHGWSLRNSRIYEAVSRFLVKPSRNQQKYRVQNMAADTLSPEILEAWDLTLSEIDGIREVAVANDIPLLILVTPYRFQLKNPKGLNQPQRMLQGYARGHDIPIIDLLPMFETFLQTEKNATLFNDENHFSVQGHLLTASILARYLLEQVFS